MSEGQPACDLSHDAIRSIVSGWAETELLVRRIYLFGSRARGDNRPDSDVDLAILNGIDPAELATCIRSALPRDGQHMSQLAASARAWTFCENQERWQAGLAALFSAPVQIEGIRKIDRVVRPSLKRCRILLYRSASNYAGRK